MAGLMGDLVNSTQALSNHASSLNTIGRNLSNVNNSSYARQTVQTESYAGPGGAYYTRSQIISSRDAVLDRQVTNEVSATGAAAQNYQLYYQLNNVMSEQLNGSIGASLSTAQAEGTGITGGLSSFFNSWSALSASPQNYGAQSSVYSSAEELVTRLNSASESLDKVQESLDASLESQVSQVNALLEKIATLNSNIVRMEARQSGSASSLKDDRQAAMEELASLMDFSSTSEEDGSITIKLPGADGQTIVSNGTFGSISISKDGDGNNTGLVASFGGANTTLSPNSGSLSVLDPVNTSAIIGSLRGELNALASQLITSVNAAYQQSGQGDFFSGSGAGDISLLVANASSIVANSSTEAEGGNSVASAISALSTQSFSSGSDQIGGTFTSFAAAIATDVASNLSRATSTLETQEQMENLVRENRDNLTGVSTEEEMSSLLRAQNAYQASARVMSIINSLLELVTTRLGN